MSNSDQAVRYGTDRAGEAIALLREMRILDQLLETQMEVIGTRFDRLTIIQTAGPDRSRDRRVLVRCECGTVKAVMFHNLRQGRAKSCGCSKPIPTSLTHGESRAGKHTAEYRSWAGMKRRCLNPNCRDFKHYGGRGVTICVRWLKSYENFLADMGRKPTPGHSIDRIDNDGDYSPGNCRWATSSEQILNQRKPLGASGFRGVTFTCGRWRAQITLAGRNTYLGRFDTAEAAQAAYIAALNRKNSFATASERPPS